MRIVTWYNYSNKKHTMSQALISIIVPIYKVEKYLSRCIDSILAQTYKNLEIILVDDGSPDKCPEICDKYAKEDSRIKVIHKKNGGVSSARNAGLDVATGKYIFFVDSDDIITEDALSNLYEKATEAKAKLAIGGITQIYQSVEIYSLDVLQNFLKRILQRVEDLI